MKIDINGVSITLTEEQIEEVAKHLAKKEEPQHLPKGTICWVWDDENFNPFLRVADGDGEFYYDGYCRSKKGMKGTKWEHYEPIEMGLQFSKEVIYTEDITLDMHKQLALCWDRGYKTSKNLRVIDASYKCTFWNEGDKGGSVYDS